MIFNIPFTDDNIHPSIMTRFIYDEKVANNFTVIVSGVKYMFNTPDFMQGFATGAQWLNEKLGNANIDHHQYWSDLMMLLYDDNEVPIYIPITF